MTFSAITNIVHPSGENNFKFFGGSILPAHGRRDVGPLGLLRVQVSLPQVATLDGGR
jgi:hypothetical protein